MSEYVNGWKQFGAGNIEQDGGLLIKPVHSEQGLPCPEIYKYVEVYTIEDNIYAFTGTVNINDLRQDTELIREAGIPDISDIDLIHKAFVIRGVENYNTHPLYKENASSGEDFLVTKEELYKYLSEESKVMSALHINLSLEPEELDMNEFLFEIDIDGKAYVSTYADLQRDSADCVRSLYQEAIRDYNSAVSGMELFTSIDEVLEAVDSGEIDQPDFLITIKDTGEAQLGLYLFQKQYTIELNESESLNIKDTFNKALEFVGTDVCEYAGYSVDELFEKFGPGMKAHQASLNFELARFTPVPEFSNSDFKIYRLEFGVNPNDYLVPPVLKYRADASEEGRKNHTSFGQTKDEHLMNYLKVYNDGSMAITMSRVERGKPTVSVSMPLEMTEASYIKSEKLDRLNKNPIRDDLLR